MELLLTRIEFTEKSIKDVFIYTLSDPMTKAIRYVGKTVNIKQRLNCHIQHSRMNTKTHLKSWIKGLINKRLKPIIEIVEISTLDDWQHSERYWISQFRAWGFDLVNTTDGGDSPPIRVGDSHHMVKYGMNAKQRETMKRVGFQKGNIPHNINGHHTQDAKDKMSNLKRGVKLSKSHCTNKHKFILGSANPRARIVLNLNTGIYYDTLKEACNIFNIKYRYMTAVMQGKLQNKTPLIYA